MLFILSVANKPIMLSVVMLNVVMLGVVAPWTEEEKEKEMKKPLDNKTK